MIQAWLDAMWKASWQGALLIGVVWVSLVVFRRTPARVRSWLWLIAVSKPLLVLFFVVELPVLAPVVAGGSESSSTLQSSIVYSGEGSSAIAFDWRIALLGLWCVGVLMVLWRACAEHARLRALANEALPVTEIDSRVPIRTHVDVPAPMVIGLWRPLVLLPLGIEERLSKAELEMVLEHEFAHVRRRDVLASLYFFVCQALFFFHPSVWLAKREWQLDREAACDAEAMDATGASPGDYAAMLLKVATTAQRTPVLAMSAVPTYKSLQRRINDMKKPNESKRAGKALIPILVLLVSASAMPFVLVQRKPNFGAGIFETVPPDVKVTSQKKGEERVAQVVDAQGVPAAVATSSAAPVVAGQATTAAVPSGVATVVAGSGVPVPASVQSTAPAVAGQATTAGPRTGVVSGTTAPAAVAGAPSSANTVATSGSAPSVAVGGVAQTATVAQDMPPIGMPPFSATVVLKDKLQGGDGLRKSVSMKLNDIDINMFFAQLSLATDMKIMPKGVRSGLKLNIELENVSLRDVLDTVAKVYVLDWALLPDGTIEVKPFRK